MKLTCPKCNRTLEYGGYPPEPILSSVLCLACHYMGPGATYKHLHPVGERCAKGLDFALAARPEGSTP